MAGTPNIKSVAKSLSELTQMMKETKEQQSQMMKETKEQLNSIEGKLEDINERMRKVEIAYTKLQDIPDKVSRLEQDLELLDNIPDRVSQLEINMENMIEQKIKETMDKSNGHINNTLGHQQRFLESVDANLRSKNAIFLGIGEGQNDLGENDKEKVIMVMTKAGIDSEIANDMTTKRLGKEREGNDPPRPILVTVANQNLRNQMLEKAKNLKEVDGFDRIFIKKDIYPPTRREWDRLRKREREEKANSINLGVKIELNWKERTLKRDGVIIDRFNPIF